MHLDRFGKDRPQQCVCPDPTRAAAAAYGQTSQQVGAPVADDVGRDLRLGADPRSRRGVLPPQAQGAGVDGPSLEVTEFWARHLATTSPDLFPDMVRWFTASPPGCATSGCLYK